MRYYMLLILCLALTDGRADEPTGIRFFRGSWKDVLAEAKRLDKPVFVDIYTSWCGPCKLMAKQAFPDPKVGEKFNAHFISYQIDAEKGEGVAVAKQYAVDAYPTSLYVSADGNLIHRAIGYSGIKGMLAEADKALEVAKDPNSLSVMEAEYAAGKRDPAFLATYLKKRGSVEMPNGEALDAYLKTVPEADWSSEQTIELIAGNLRTDNRKAFDVLMQRMGQLTGKLDEKESQLQNKMSQAISRIIQAQFQQAIARKDEQQLADVIATNEAYLNAARSQKLTQEQANGIANGYRTRFYLQTKNVAKYRSMAESEATKLMAIPIDSIRAKDVTTYQRFEEETKQVPDSVKQSENFRNYTVQMIAIESKQMAMKLNSFAWNYYENLTDPKDLNQALTWSARSLDYERNGMYLDTYAHLLSKLGHKAEAVKTQEEAIVKLKAAGQDTKEFEKSLAEMKQK